jgi:hypothetical protein
MDQIEYNGKQYSFTKLDAFTQLHVARRIAPILTSLGTSISDMVSAGKQLSGDDQMMMMVGKATEVVARMTDDDVNYVIKACMNVTRRQAEDGRWTKVLQGSQLMFDSDMDMQVLLRLTVEVIKVNMGGFFPMLPGGQQSQEG